MAVVASGDAVVSPDLLPEPGLEVAVDLPALDKGPELAAAVASALSAALLMIAGLQAQDPAAVGDAAALKVRALVHAR